MSSAGLDTFPPSLPIVGEIKKVVDKRFQGHPTAGSLFGKFGSLPIAAPQVLRWEVPGGNISCPGGAFRAVAEPSCLLEFKPKNQAPSPLRRDLPRLTPDLLPRRVLG